MCGIVGVWDPEREVGEVQADLAQAVDRLAHRGPDDRGIWTNARGVGLGHRRLAVLDLSDAGHQPKVSVDGDQVMVFNGEIYNFMDLKPELVAAGHTFSGTGDTEVILAAFREWGAGALDRFIGMFAIALWDEREGTLELVRDRVGVKPLYYGWDRGCFWFTSELKALRAFRNWRPQIDRRSLGEYLQYGYIAGDRTIYQNVFKLPPGHRLQLRGDPGPRVEPYWSAVPDPGDLASIRDDEAESELESLLVDAFRHRMVSDVPVGVFLSGGVDSSIVTALLAKHHNQTIHTFTIGFEEGGFDESEWARKVAEHCGTEHTEYRIQVGEALEIARNWGALFDEPFGDTSGIPTYLVSRLASQSVKVVLSADGGDELFSGYEVYGSVLERMRMLERVPRWLSGAARSGLGLAAPPRLGQRAASQRAQKIHRLQQMMVDPTPGRILDSYLSYWQPDEIDRLIGGYRSPRVNADTYPGEAIDQLSLWDIQHYLPEDILTKVDRTTMAVSIEGREPLLDHRLIEFALRLPSHLRRGELGSKHLLKSVLYRHVPRELVDRPKKGFSIPLNRWLRQDLRELVEDHLAEDRIRGAGLMDPTLVSRLVRNFYAGDESLSGPLWFALALEMWRETWITS